jgi:hypothetical protein
MAVGILRETGVFNKALPHSRLMSLLLVAPSGISFDIMDIMQ